MGRSLGANELLPTDTWALLAAPDLGGQWQLGVSEGDPTLTAGLEGLVAKVAAWSEAVPGSADVVHLVDPDHRQLGAAARMLNEDGLVVVERHLRKWRRSDRQSPTDPSLRLVERYTICPAGHHRIPTMWIPTTNPAVVSILDTVTDVDERAGLARRWYGRLLRIAATRLPRRLIQRAWLWFPTRPWVSVEFLATRAPAEPELLTMRLGGSATADQPIITHCDVSTAAPIAVTKLPSGPRQVADLELESANLTYLAELAAPVRGVPRPVTSQWSAAGVARGRPRTSLTQSFVPGAPMSDVLDQSRYDGLVAEVGSWATELALATRRPGPASATTVGQWLDRLGSPEPDTARELMARTRTAVGELTFTGHVMQHRDFGPWNLHLDDTEGLGVVDWADATQDGLPLIDLVHFCTHAAIIATGGYEPDELRRAYDASVDPSTELGRAAASAIERYRQAVDLDPADLAPLRIAAWVQAMTEEEPEDRWTSIYPLLWRWELDALN